MKLFLELEFINFFHILKVHQFVSENGLISDGNNTETVTCDFNLFDRRRMAMIPW